jgi:hypothetical protein
MRTLLYIIFFFCSIKAIANNYNKDYNISSTYCSTNINTDGNSRYSNKLSLIPNVVYGFAIDGEISIIQENYLIRVLVKERDGKEHLVMESYREIQGNIPTRFKDYSEETFLTNGLNLDSIIIYTHGAILKIDGFRYVSKNQAFNTNKSVEGLSKENRDRIIRTNVEKINDYNEKHNLLWRADKTWLSQQNYVTRKRLLGVKDNCSTRGIEYYAGGIIEIDDEEQMIELPRIKTTNEQPLRIDTAYVENFDWRHRHGKNWMTPIKHQGGSNCCFFFTCIGAVEALTNLYYNQKIDLSLSEQELISCCGLPDPYIYGAPSDMREIPLNYLVSHGVCDSLSYPFANFPNQSCLSELINPNEQISISGFHEIINNENEIKKAIINHGPLIASVRSNVWMHHSMVLVGYGTLQAGDTIYHHLWYNYDTQSYVHDKYLTVEEDDPRIGRTYMVYKNSYGLADGDSNLGYMYIIHNNYNTSLSRTFYLDVPITSMNYSDDDIILEDADGDGYFFWGLGSKPSTSPSWIPDEPDGDDSDYQYGPMDNHGNLEDLELRGLQTTHITMDSTFTSRAFFYTNTCVCSMSKMTIKSTITLYGNTKIIVEANGELVIDGGVLENADIELNSGSKLVLKNGGTIIMRNNKDFYAPIGAIVTIEEGMIE